MTEAEIKREISETMANFTFNAVNVIAEYEKLLEREEDVCASDYMDMLMELKGNSINKLDELIKTAEGETK